MSRKVSLLVMLLLAVVWAGVCQAQVDTSREVGEAAEAQAAAAMATGAPDASALVDPNAPAIYTEFNDLGYPSFCAPQIDVQVYPNAMEYPAGQRIEKPSKCNVILEYLGVGPVVEKVAGKDIHSWVVRIHNVEGTEWHFPDDTAVLVRPLTPDVLEHADFKAGDIFIRPNLYVLDLQYTGKTREKEVSTGGVRTLWEMKVLDNYEDPAEPEGGPKPGSIVLVRDRNDRFEIEDGVLTFDEKWPLKPLKRVDFWVVGVYLAFMILIGFVVAQRNKNAAEYFKGGGHTPWWLAGVSLWMSTFSTITFISGAGSAFERISYALVSYFVGLGSYILGYAILAARWRRTRSLTTMQYLEERYDNPTHQLFSWVDVIIGIVYAGAQLLSLVAITGAALNLTPSQMPAAIIIVGLAIVLYTVLGGFWAVVMTDMLQAMVLLPIVLVLAYISLRDIGGLAPILHNTPTHFFALTSKTFNAIVLAVGFVSGLFAGSSGGAAQRYFAVRDEKAARKVALLTGILTVVGPIIWFIPPMVAAWLYRTDQMTMVRLIPDYPIRESVYILMARRILPTGLIGLLLAAMFAATMSSIDTTFNFRGAILSRDIIKKYLMPKISDHALLGLGRIITLIVGLIAIGLAIIMRIYSKSMFQVIFTIGGKILLPAGVPIVFGLIFKNTKRWTGFACLTIGLSLGLVEFVLGAALQVSRDSDRYLQAVVHGRGVADPLHRRGRPGRLLHPRMDFAVQGPRIPGAPRRLLGEDAHAHQQRGATRGRGRRNQYLPPRRRPDAHNRLHDAPPSLL